MPSAVRTTRAMCNKVLRAIQRWEGINKKTGTPCAQLQSIPRPKSVTCHCKHTYIHDIVYIHHAIMLYCWGLSSYARLFVRRPNARMQARCIEVCILGIPCLHLTLSTPVWWFNCSAGERNVCHVVHDDSSTPIVLSGGQCAIIEYQRPRMAHEPAPRRSHAVVTRLVLVRLRRWIYLDIA